MKMYIFGILSAVVNARLDCGIVCICGVGSNSVVEDRGIAAILKVWGGWPAVR